jgi:phosphatidylinositol alpha-1,6-mannosyltransferase
MSAAANPATTDGRQAPRGRVLMVTSTFPRWQDDACPTFVGDLARDLHRLGWKVDVLAPHAKWAARDERMDGLHVRRFRYAWPAGAQRLSSDGGALSALRRSPLNALLVPFFVIGQFAALLRLLARRRYDIVQSHWLLPQGLTAGLAARLTGTRHIATAHGSDVTALRASVFAWLKRLALRSADAVTVNSEATGHAVAALGPRIVRPRLIPLGVDTGGAARPAAVAEFAQRFRHGDGPLILFAGRLAAEKGACDLIEALPKILAALPDAMAVIAGDGPERPSLEALAETRGVGASLRFAGWLNRSALAAAMAAADMVVVSSRREGQGLVALEAMAAGTPVIAADVGGLPETVRDDETGLLIPPEAPEALAGAVIRLAGDPDLSQRLAQAGGAMVRKTYSSAAAAEAFGALYQAVLGMPPVPLGEASPIRARRA